MGSGKNSILLVIFISLIAATAVSAAPTIFTNSPSADAGNFNHHTTIFMVLTGFLCVSLVIDRRLWLATLTAPQRSGQSEFHPIPQLAGIPAGTITFPPYISMHDKIRQIRNTQFAIKHFSYSLNPALICMAPRAEQNITFSPEFIFVRLARGPPILT